MARITRRSLDTLFKKFEPGNEYNPGDGSEVKISDQDRDLLKQVFKQYDEIRSGVSTGPQGTSGYFQKILKRFVDDNELLEQTKEFLEDGEAINQKRHQIARRATDAIKRKLEFHARTGELAEEEVERLKEHYKILKKEEKEYAKIEKGYKKGNAMAEAHMQSIFGISRSFDGPGGLIASAKGFAKGIGNMLKPGNLLMSLFTKMFEQAMATDKARAELFSKSGMPGFTKQLMDINSEIARYHGPGSEMIAKDVILEMQSEMKGFKQFVVGEEFVDMAAMTGKLKRFGVSTAAMSNIYVDLRRSIGYSASESDSVIRELYSIGKAGGRTTEETMRDFAELLPEYARFGNKVPAVFRRLAATARLTNLKMGELKDITESADTTESAMKTAGKFNALLGGNFLKGMDLLTAGPAEKIRLIAEAYQEAEAKFGATPDKVKRALARNLGSAGVNAQQLERIVSASFQNFEQEVAKGEGPATDEEISTDLKKTLSVKKNIDAAMQNLIVKINQKIMQHLPEITTAVNYMADHAEYIAPVFIAAGMAASAMYAKGYFQTYIEIPRLKTQVAALNAQVKALQAAGAAKCTQSMMRAGSGVLSASATSSMGAVKNVSLSSTGALVVGEAAEQAAGSVAKSGLLSKLGGFFMNSGILKALAKFPIIETLIAMFQGYQVLTNPTLSLKEKARGFLRVVAGAAGSYLLGLLGSSVPVPGLNFVTAMLGAMAGQYLGEMLAKTKVGLYVADNLIQPMLRAFGVRDGEQNAEFRAKMAAAAKAESTTARDIARIEGRYVSEQTNVNMAAMGIQDSPVQMTAAPIKRVDFERSKNDGVLLERLEKLREGLISLGNANTSVKLFVGDNQIASAVTT